MELKNIVNISGKPGLYQVINASRSGFIVESVEEPKTRIPVNASHKVAALNDISIYTETDSIPLSQVFRTMQSQRESFANITPKSGDAELKAAFSILVPEYDTERVYVSDMKKVFRWFAILDSLIDFSKVEEENSNEETAGA